MNTHSSESTITRIVLVEDNEDDRLLLEDLLLHSADDFAVNAFNTGENALKYIEENGTNCIVLDYRLGADDGITLLSEFKKLDPFVPVIMLTGQGSEELASTAMKLGASDYLVKKNLNESPLKLAIRNAIKQGKLEETIARQSAEQRAFLEVLVHDLKAPLQNIKNLSVAAIEEEEAGDSIELKNCLTMQMEVAVRAHNLVATLENYALLDGDIEFGPVCLTEVAQAARDNLSTIIAEKNAEVTIGKLPTIVGHPPQLIQLLQNLIQNGLKYNTSENAEIVVEGRNNDIGEVFITIGDNGVGIPADNLGAIFEPFKRLWGSEQFEGSGLGLATCYKIVQRHEGQIWCTSTEGVGSEFHLSFPAS